jgi:hypothetical protein
MVSIAILILFAFGVLGVLNIGNTSLMFILWPASLYLKVGWHSSIYASIFTLSLVLLNCLMYSVVAALLRAGLRFVFRSLVNSQS